jgi:DNA-binding winged helix-turn-helix (wHTH) protein
MKLRFREFVLDTTARVLLRAEVELAVQPLVFDCIELLASRSGVLVRTDELRSRLWPSVHVADSATRRVDSAIAYRRTWPSRCSHRLRSV